MMTFHIPAHAGSGEHDYAWDYEGQWGRTVKAIDRRSISPNRLAVCTDNADAFVSRGSYGYVVQEISDEQYAALPARLRRRLDQVRA